MKYLNLLAVIASAASIVGAIELAPRSDNPKVVGLDIQRRHIPDILAHDKARLKTRQKTVEQTLDNLDTLYFANATLGTPPQNMRLHIDTGSSDLWVNVANSTLCASRSAPCIGGTYNPSRSSTYQYVNSRFNISYVDGSSASGDYVTDTMGFGGVSLQNFQFAVGQVTTSRQSVLGIGYAASEVLATEAGGASYANLPIALVESGRINRNAYSLWLNDLDASTGTILFGGVNTAKYQGPLQTVPIYATSRGRYAAFIVALSSLSLNGTNITSSNLPSPVVLDSGSTLSRVPDDIAELIYNTLGITWDSSLGAGFAPCVFRNLNADLEFGFSGLKIKVPFNELFLDYTDAYGRAAYLRNGQRACLFGIGPSLGIIPILGDTFLRSAYVVFDLDRNEVSMAQTVFNSTTDSIREIASNVASAVPGASPAPSTIRSLAVGTATDGALLGLGTGTATALNTNAAGSATATPSSSNAAYPTKAPYLVGAAVAAGAGLLL